MHMPGLILLLEEKTCDYLYPNRIGCMLRHHVIKKFATSSELYYLMLKWMYLQLKYVYIHLYIDIK
jgi:hypothetical protein